MLSKPSFALPGFDFAIRAKRSISLTTARAYPAFGGLGEDRRGWEVQASRPPERDWASHLRQLKVERLKSEVVGFAD